ncbi:MAG: DUF4260 domain-containing protein [Flavobacteriales bacterium]|jgi:hypothetical protein|nr:DUF4260 domain-containing protein [Flavobacteriales bacterium]
MKNLVRIEELIQFLACLAVLVIFCHVPWWTYILLLLGPDIGMFGYLVSPRLGAITYNLFHHKGIALLVFMVGIALIPEGTTDVLLILGTILYGHSSMDRMLGYGLKFSDGFQHTHLGWIGKGQQEK